MTKVDIKAVRPRKWEGAFLAKLKNTLNVRVSCEAAGVSRQAAYQHRDTDRRFAELWAQAEQDAVDVLEARAWERSKQSDGLLMFLLKAHRPEKYRDTVRNELTGKDGEDLFKAYVGIDPDKI